MLKHKLPELLNLFSNQNIAPERLSTKKLRSFFFYNVDGIHSFANCSPLIFLMLVLTQFFFNVL